MLPGRNGPGRIGDDHNGQINLRAKQKCVVLSAIGSYSTFEAYSVCLSSVNKVEEEKNQDFFSTRRAIHCAAFLHVCLYGVTVQQQRVILLCVFVDQSWISSNQANKPVISPASENNNGKKGQLDQCWSANEQVDNMTCSSCKKRSESKRENERE